MRGIVSVGLVISAILLGSCAADATRNRPLVTEEFMIPGPDPGVQLYVRNKRPADLVTFSSRNIVPNRMRLFTEVHRFLEEPTAQQ